MEATAITKLDLTKADLNYYKIGPEPELRDLDGYYYLSLTGMGNPGLQPFEDAIEKLYSVAYGIKFLCKAEDLDFVVPKMEGFWWIDGGLEAQHKFPQTPEDQWKWKIIIRMPDFVEGDHFYRAVAGVRQRRELDLDDLKFELINERKCVQALHIGSFYDEQPTVDRIMKFIDREGLKVNNYHHEIYLTDPRRTPEEKLRTIIRYGVE